MLKPNALLPEQYTPAKPLSGEKKLMLAVLEDARKVYMEYFRKESKREERLFKEAAEWFRSEDTSLLYSFENICRYLNLEPEYIRAGLRRWKANKLSELSHEI